LLAEMGSELLIVLGGAWLAANAVLGGLALRGVRARRATAARPPREPISLSLGDVLAPPDDRQRTG
jgi:hypothetical protein